MKVSHTIMFQSSFSPSPQFKDIGPVFLFVQNLQDVDDGFGLAWFWAKDQKGLEYLTQTDNAHTIPFNRNPRQVKDKGDIG